MKSSMKTKGMLSVLLAVLLLGTASACGDAGESGEKAKETTPSGTDTEAVTEAPDPFADFDLEGMEFRVYTSNDDPGGVGNSSYMIEGPAEETGDIVNDSVFYRNRDVEELLNVDLLFTRYEQNYTETSGLVNKLVMSGEDAYDVIISDLYPMAALSVRGTFLNVADAPYTDFDKTYWYRDYMDQLSLDGKKMYLLAGDFFMDILRSAHALYFNKDMLAQYYDSSDLLYEDVLAGKWTFDKFIGYITDMYQDLNGNGVVDYDDQFGYTSDAIWGPSIPFIISADLDFVKLENDGTMSIAVNNERSVTLLDKLGEIFYNRSIYKGGLDDTLDLFKSGRCLFLGYFRLGALEDLRDMEHEIGVVPYPKFDENQENYITSSHDTTEIGVIPITNSKFDNTCLVLEVLNRETQKTILPAYYETALKVKYTRDELSAQMIDIIHDHIGGSFALAFNNACADIFLKSTFYNALNENTRDFASRYAKVEKSGQTKLDALVEQFSALEP